MMVCQDDELTIATLINSLEALLLSCYRNDV